jgi:multiple sugar transport system substrate-binding protein
VITLLGITWDHPRGRAPLEASVAEWRERAGVEVRWEARSLKDFGDAPLERLAAEYDLLVIDHPHAGIAAASGAVLAYEELVGAEVLAELAKASAGPSYRSYHYAGKQWALPVDSACQVACRRADLWTEGVRLPVNWDEVFALAEGLRGRGRWVGMALCPTDTLCSTLTLCAQLGDPFREGVGAAGFPREETLARAFGILRRLAEVCHPGSLGWNPIRLYDHMAAHEDVVYSPLGFGYTNYARAEGSPGRVGRARLSFCDAAGGPGALLGGAGLAVSARGAHPREAAEYAAWVCSAEYQRGGYTAAGGQPGHGAAWADAAADAVAGGFFSGTRATLAAASVRPRHAGWPEFQEQFGDRVHAWLRGGGRAEEIGALVPALRAGFERSL